MTSKSHLIALVAIFMLAPPAKAQNADIMKMCDALLRGGFLCQSAINAEASGQATELGVESIAKSCYDSAEMMQQPYETAVALVANRADAVEGLKVLATIHANYLKFLLALQSVASTDLRAAADSNSTIGKKFHTALESLAAPCGMLAGIVDQ